MTRRVPLDRGPTATQHALHFGFCISSRLCDSPQTYSNLTCFMKLLSSTNAAGPHSHFDGHTRLLATRLYKDYVHKHFRLLIATSALLLIIAATTSVQPLLLQQTFDKVFQGKDLTYLTLLPVAIICLCIVQAITTYYSTILMNRFGSSLTADMRTDLFRHILDNDIDFYAAHDSGNLISRVSGETIGISIGVQRFFNVGVRQLITSMGLILVMLYQSAELTVISLAAFALAYYPIRRITKRLRKLVRQFNENSILLNSRLLESFEGIRVIKAFAKEEFEVTKIGQCILDIKAVNNKMAGIASLAAPLMQCLAGIAVAFVIWYGGYQLINGKMTEGELIAFTTSLLMLSKPVKSLTSSGSIMTAALVNAERYYHLLDTKRNRISRDQGTAISVTSEGIRFDKVHFEYPNGTEALKGVSFTMEAGKKTALVGHSGSGKSTVFNLLLKFYDPTAGTISIDRQSIDDASINSVRDSIALVSQDIFIFDDTARNNIGYGREGATEEEIGAAARAAKCHDFIMNLPGGYDTRLGFFGQNLSGGQKQRIAIARAFVRKSPILLLDEATSSLDPKTEMEIQDSLEELAHNRTTVIIAHRLSTVMKVDKLIMMEDGAVKAVGSHEELIESSAAYRDLFGI